MNPEISPQANAVILARIAIKAIEDARKTWSATSTDEHVLRRAFRACVLAARLARKAATAWSGRPEGKRFATEAKRLESAGADLQHRLTIASLG